jgi:hypothetical protein
MKTKQSPTIRKAETLAELGWRLGRIRKREKVAIIQSLGIYYIEAPGAIVRKWETLIFEGRNKDFDIEAEILKQAQSKDPGDLEFA